MQSLDGIDVGRKHAMAELVTQDMESFVDFGLVDVLQDFLDGGMIAVGFGSRLIGGRGGDGDRRGEQQDEEVEDTKHDGNAAV